MLFLMTPFDRQCQLVRSSQLATIVEERVSQLLGIRRPVLG